MNWAHHIRPGGSTLFVPGTWVCGLVLITTAIVLVGVYIYRQGEDRRREQRPDRRPRTYEFDDLGRMKRPNPEREHPE